MSRESSYLALIVDDASASGIVARDVFEARHDDRAAAGLAPGTVVRVGVAIEVIAGAGSALADLYRLVADKGLAPNYPDEVLVQTGACLAAPGLDDGLIDLTDLPFVTVDGPKTRDLDQALHVEVVGEALGEVVGEVVGEAGAGAAFVVRYAIADASYYVRPGTPLFADALKRGASYYLPGLNVPMLPRELSEGLISLNAGVERRACVFEMHVRADGTCVETVLRRAKIRSRAQLTFDQVVRFLEGAASAVPAETRTSLRAFADVGEVRLDEARRRHVLRHRPEEVRIRLNDDATDEAELGFVVVEEVRNRAEMYGEQLSLLCNIEGGRLLREGDDEDEHAQPIFRTHPAPSPERIEDFRELVERVLAIRQAPETFAWDPAQTPLGTYLAGLPVEGPFAGLSRAIARQAVMVNVRSTFSAEPGPHFGVGADVYARFSAPMREIVGVFVHQELLEILEGKGRSDAAIARDAKLRERVSEQANAAKSLQRELTREANYLVLERLFRHALETEAAGGAQVPWYRGTVMGLTRSKVHVRLADPPIDVKVYVRDLGGAEVDRSGAAMRMDGGLMAVLGDEVSVRPRGWDPKSRRFAFGLTT